MTPKLSERWFRSTLLKGTEASLRTPPSASCSGPCWASSFVGALALSAVSRDFHRAHSGTSLMWGSLHFLSTARRIEATRPHEGQAGGKVNPLTYAVW